MADSPLPLAERSDADLPGHWLLARLGKRVLRPGGLELTTRLLAAARIGGSDVVELGPGLGRTASDIIAAQPRSYVGVDDTAAATENVKAIVAPVNGAVVVADASTTGLPDGSADVVVGEAMLTMQGEKAKRAIIAEAFRVLRPGGRYAIHELSLTPDDLPEGTKTELRKALARSIKVNARPLTAAEWRDILERGGFEIEHVGYAPMALLQPRRVLADEGVLGTARIVGNVLRDKPARARVLAMRSTFNAHRRELRAISVIARKPKA